MSVRVGVITLAVVLAAAMLPELARAQTQQQIDWCNGKDKASPDLQISGCTAVIQSGKFTGSNLAKAFVLRGKGYSRKGGNIDLAIADFDQAIRLDPKNANAFSERGLKHLQKKEYDRALRDLAQSIKLVPSDANPWAYQGDVYHHMGKYDQAITSFGEAIKRSPNWMWPYNDRGELYIERGDYQLAIRDFDQVIRVSQTYAMGWNNRCRALAIVGQLEQALSDCNEAIKINPKFINSMEKSGKVSAIQDRALVQLKAGRFDLALEDYDKAFELLPKSAEVLFGRGMAKLKKGDRAGGEADMASAKAIDRGIATRFTDYGVK